MATYKEQNKLNVPHLRFPEFHGEWEKCKLGDIAEFSTARVSSAKLDCKNYVSTENMLQDFQGVVEAKSVPNDTNVISFTCGDILISNIRPYLKKVWKATFDGGCSSDVFVLHATDAITSDYLHYAIANDRFINFVMSGAKGVKMPRGDKNQMRTYQLSLPSIQEQHKIAKLLTLLDERIATQSKLIEDLKKLKAAISYKLFSDKNMFGCKKHLSEICSLKNGYAFKSSTYKSDGMYNIVTIANVTGTRYISSVCNKITDVPSDIQLHQQLCFNDILISMTGNVGRVSLCDEGYYLQNQRVGLITVSDNFNKEFIFQVLSTERFENEMIAKAQGAAQMNISKFDIESYIIPYTSNTQIIDNVATLLKLYDEKILVSEDLLSSFTKQKQSLLHQMFI